MLIILETWEETPIVTSIIKWGIKVGVEIIIIIMKIIQQVIDKITIVIMIVDINEEIIWICIRILIIQMIRIIILDTIETWTIAITNKALILVGLKILWVIITMAIKITTNNKRTRNLSEKTSKIMIIKDEEIKIDLIITIIAFIIIATIIILVLITTLVLISQIRIVQI